MTTALALAFGAGMVATVNPCGFAMLPAYLSYFMGDTGPETSAVLRAALRVGRLSSLRIPRRLWDRRDSHLGISPGVAATGYRGWRSPSALRSSCSEWRCSGIRAHSGIAEGGTRIKPCDLRGVFGFGISYAVASLSCTFPVFLSVIATQLATRCVGEGLLIFACVRGWHGGCPPGGDRGPCARQAVARQSIASPSAYINEASGILVVAGAIDKLVLDHVDAIWRCQPQHVLVVPLCREPLVPSVLNLVADNTLLVGLGARCRDSCCGPHRRFGR